MKNDPQIFKPNQLKNIILLLVSSTFVIIGIFNLDSDPNFSWVGIIFFGLGIIVSIIQFFPNSTYLKLTDEGFEVKSLFRSSFTKWTEIKDLREGQIKGNKMIFFNYTENHNKWNIGKEIAKSLTDTEGAIQSSYNIKTQQLLNLMKEYKNNVKA
jgi:hypothetical protein